MSQLASGRAKKTPDGRSYAMAAAAGLPIKFQEVRAGYPASHVPPPPAPLPPCVRAHC